MEWAAGPYCKAESQPKFLQGTRMNGSGCLLILSFYTFLWISDILSHAKTYVKCENFTTVKIIKFIIIGLQLILINCDLIFNFSIEGIMCICPGGKSPVCIKIFKNLTQTIFQNHSNLTITQTQNCELNKSGLWTILLKCFIHMNTF